MRMTRLMLKLSIITRRRYERKKIPPIHPGEILLEEFLNPMNLSQNKIALDMRVPPRRINEIVLGKRRITADTALRLAKYFNMSPEFWLGLQMDYDLDITEDQIGERIQKEVRSLNQVI
jgi:antitoxin HigA-1